MRGKIIKGIAGFYYVHAENGVTYECKAKGGFRNKNVKPLVGDDVDIDIVDFDKLLGNIVEILPRSSEMIRPAVANVDQALLVFAISHPEPNLRLLDSFLVMMEGYELPTIICFNKTDETGEQEMRRLSDIYSDSGCRVMFTSTVTGDGMKELREMLHGHTTALAGPSGVGKSSILNALVERAYMETGSISEKIGRGRHTTRHSEVFVLDDESYILDTPGFTSLSVMVDDRDRLRLYIPELDSYEGKCRFSGCVHINEPDCAVKAAVNSGKINAARYESYVAMYNELNKRR